MRRIVGALRTWLRGNNTGARRALTSKTRLAIELLETRLAPTASASTFQSVIGLPEVQAVYPYNGAGYSVAILDTGIDYNDTDLGGGFGPGYRVEAGYNFVNNTANPMDDNGHGTLVAGIIGSSNPNDPGIAPNVNFIALKVLNANNTGSWAAIDQGLQWVIAHRTQYNIVAVNLSLGSGDYTTDNFDILESDFATLKSLGVFTAVASGNNFYTYNSVPGLAYPAVDPDVVSVGATWVGNFGSNTWSSGAIDYSSATDEIVSITQRDSSLDLLAPGAWITSDGLDNTQLTEGGTSMAAAVVTGAAVLLYQAYDQTGQASLANETNVLHLMQSTGVSIVDSNNGATNVKATGLTFKRLNLEAAMAAIGQPIAPPTLAPIASQTLLEKQTTVVPLAASDPNGLPLTYSVSQTYLPALAYQLQQQYGLSYDGTYAQNSQGMNEKWILGSGSVWYCILPDGELRRWAGTAAATLTPANLVATLSSAYWTDPSLLWNAPYAGMPPTVFSFAGSKLSIRSPAPWLGTYSVTVSATDGHYTVQQTFNVTEVAPSTPPVLTTIANQTMQDAPHQLTLPLSATDTDNGAITFSAQVLPSNGQTPAVTASVTGNQLTISPAVGYVGTFTVQITATDGSLSASETFTVTVTHAAPVLSAIANQTASHTHTTVVTLSATDADNDALTYSAQALPINGQAAPLSVAIQGNQLTITPGRLAVGTFTIQVSVTDGIATTTGTFTITLTNAAPVLSSIANQTASHNHTTVLTLSATDADNDALTYSAQALPINSQAAPLSVAVQGNQLTITPGRLAVGTFTIQVSVTDGIATTTGTFTITLTNAAPVLSPIANQSASHNQTTVVTLSATDADNDALTYSAQALPTNGHATPLSVAVQGNQLTITPGRLAVGTFTIQVSVTDGIATTTGTFTITLTNAAPVLSPIANQTASHNQTTVVTLSATDADNDALTYSAQALPINGQAAPLSVAVQGNQLTITPGRLVVGTYTIQVSVTDGIATTTGTFTITLTNAAPVLSAISAQTMATGQLTLTVPLAASDADNDVLTFQAAAETPSAAMYQLEQQYGFHQVNGSYYLNLWGQNEKWVVGSNNIWYALLPNGNLYRWTQSMAITMESANLVATLSPAVYAAPSLLINAKAPAAPALTYSFSGSQLTIQRPASLTGAFDIDVTVSDGLTSSMQTFQLTLN